MNIFFAMSIPYAKSMFAGHVAPLKLKPSLASALCSTRKSIRAASSLVGQCATIEESSNGCLSHNAMKTIRIQIVINNCTISNLNHSFL